MPRTRNPPPATDLTLTPAKTARALSQEELEFAVALEKAA